MRTLVVTKTSNAKTGPMAATYRTADTCPTSCPLRDAGCYARGRIFGIPARLGAEDGGEYSEVRALARNLRLGAMVRANVSGDMLNEAGRPDFPYAAALSHVATERPDVAVYGYTHAWRSLDPEIAPGVALNASCESPEEIIAAAAAGWPTVTTATDASDPIIGQTIAGRRVIVCPAQTRDGVTCATCGLCARPARRSTVAFLVHGSGKAQAARAIRATRKEGVA
jgi:hypothetical protein